MVNEMVKSNKVQNLLRFLEKNTNTKISVKDILRAVQPEGDSKKRKGRRSRNHLQTDPTDPAILLAELELLGMVRLNGSRVVPASPFLVRGRVSVSPRGIIFVMPRAADALAQDVFVHPRNSMEAFPGDEVMVRLSDKSRDRFEGEVVRIVKRARKEFRMKLLDKPKKDGVPGTILDVPGHLPALLETDRMPSDLKSRLRPDTVVIVSLPGDTTKFMGSYFRTAEFLGFEKDLDEDPDFSRVRMKYNLEPIYPKLPLPSVDDKPGPDTVPGWKKRKDLRDLFTITIDGDDSKDFDDAISMDFSGKRTWTLHVHIADVAHYVEKGTDLDREAGHRATSVYLVNRVVPMLPPVLSENLCSLIQGEDRLAFTAEMEINPANGEIRSSKFYRSIIRVDKRLTYRIAEQILDKETVEFPEHERDTLTNLKVLLPVMWELATVMRNTRFRAGRIDLNVAEPVIKTEGDGVKGVEYRDRLKSSMLIEEFMLTANQAVARFLNKKKANVLYRVHEEMDETKLDNLNMFFRLYNVPFELKNTDPGSLMKALKTVREHPRASDLERIFNLLLLKSFMQAVYRGEPAGHWGLAFADYCHFTSPIRRYPDLVVHRVLAAITEKNKQPYTAEEIHELGIHTSEMERKAMEAERDMQKLKVIRFVEKSGRTRFRGFISGMKTDRVFMELLDFPAEGIVSLNHLTNDQELILPDRFSVYVKKLSRPAFLGEEWELELERVDTEEIRLYFKPVWEKTKKAHG